LIALFPFLLPESVLVMNRCCADVELLVRCCYRSSLCGAHREGKTVLHGAAMLRCYLTCSLPSRW